MPSIAEILNGKLDPHDGEPAAPPMPTREQQANALSEFFQRYHKARQELPKMGDLVVCRPDAPFYDKDTVFIVVDVNDFFEETATPDFGSGEIGSLWYGRYPDIRLARVFPDGNIATFWQDASDFVPYKADE